MVEVQLFLRLVRGGLRCRPFPVLPKVSDDDVCVWRPRLLRVGVGFLVLASPCPNCR